MAARVPETTQSAGPLTAAIDRPAPSSGTRASSDKATATVAPSGRRSSIRPRAATIARAPGSDITPATHAATSSPRLCPTMAAGSTPRERHNAESAYSTVKVESSEAVARSSAAAAIASSPGSGNSQFASETPCADSTRARIRSTSSRKTGSVA